jgi:hypothetical protein
MARQDQQHWKEFVQIFDEIRQNLEKLENGVRLLGGRPEVSNEANLLRSTIQTTFLAFLDVWIDAISTIKRAPTSTLSAQAFRI